MDLVEFDDDVADDGAASFKTIEAFRGTFLILYQRGAEDKGRRRRGSWP